MTNKRLPDFQTARLAVTHWEPVIEGRTTRARLVDDLPNLLTDAVTAELPPALHLPQGRAQDWIDARLSESDVYLVQDRGTARLIGLMILGSPPAKDEPALHLGYLLGEFAWGQGFASELVQGVVRASKSIAPLCLIAGVGVQNPASSRVLTKAGFARDPACSTPDTDIFICEVRS